jgi:hypothetical protein
MIREGTLRNWYHFYRNLHFYEFLSFLFFANHTANCSQIYWKYCIFRISWQMYGKSNGFLLTMVLLLTASYSQLLQRQVEVITSMAFLLELPRCPCCCHSHHHFCHYPCSAVVEFFILSSMIHFCCMKLYFLVEFFLLT